jgi:crossover junction endodeoxyribonuclease RuvC
MKYIMGLDPGWSGGVAIVGQDSNYVEAIPFTGKTEWDIIESIEHLADKAEVCYLEKVHAMPAQGVCSVFKFGHNYGLVRAALYINGMVINEVTPQKWQSLLGCLSKGNKNVTKTKAQQLYPGVKITHATADAILLAEYGRLMESAVKFN